MVLVHPIIVAVLIALVVLWQRWDTPPDEIGQAEYPRSQSADLEAMVKIPAGSFTMGSSTSEPARKPDETQHRVTLTKDFYLMKYEVTQGRYKAITGRNPSGFSRCGLDCPVEKVSWYDAVKYANMLSDSQGLSRCYSGSGDTTEWDKSCTGYRLPTEAEWEYAARAGQSTSSAGSEDPRTVAWFDHNSGGRPHPVGTKQPNAWGLHDMNGNVWEWVWDWRANYTGDTTDPTGPATGSSRVVRGGSWGSDAWDMRIAYRFQMSPGSRRYNSFGFRLARTAQ